MKILTIFLLCSFITYAQQKEDFDSYLKLLRQTCIEKDTAQLHKLIGDRAFGFSCYGLEMPNREFSTDWLIFKNHFHLEQNPDSSSFWNSFIRLSNAGYYSVDALTCRVPSFNFWGMGKYSTNAPAFNYFDYILYPDTITIYTPLSNAEWKHHSFKPLIDYTNSYYPYVIKYLNTLYWELYEDDLLIGLVKNNIFV